MTSSLQFVGQKQKQKRIVFIKLFIAPNLHSLSFYFPLNNKQQKVNIEWLRALEIYMLACHANIIHFTYVFNFMHPKYIRLYKNAMLLESVMHF